MEQQPQDDNDEEEETRRQDPIVTSGESDEGVLDSDNDEYDYNGRHYLSHHPAPSRHHDNTGDALFYDENADNEDEAYVYNYLRGGAAETSAMAATATSSSSDKKNKTIVKPRNSDAVLSCPCCLSIVCMDCQKHERYANQYRSMFVMNIMVQWDVRLRFDNVQGQLVPFEASATDTSNAPRVVEDHGEEDDDDEEEEEQKGKDETEVIYYKVCCANCQTQVASLDMTDEVYHFYGCVASA